MPHTQAEEEGMYITYLQLQNGGVIWDHVHFTGEVADLEMSVINQVDDGSRWT